MRIEIQRRFDDADDVTLGTLEVQHATTVYELQQIIESEWEEWQEVRTEDNAESDFIDFVLGRHREFKSVPTAYIVSVG